MALVQAYRPWIQDRPTIVGLFACYAAYMAAAGFGEWMIETPGIAIVVWPPNGVILAVLLANERRHWPWWIAVAAIGETTANFIWFHNPALPTAGYIGANALEVVAAAALLSNFLKGVNRLPILTRDRRPKLTPGFGQTVSARRAELVGVAKPGERGLEGTRF